MSKLSGLVAILTEDLSSVQELKDLGPTPIGVKPGRVLPLEDIEVLAPEGYHLSNEIFTILEDKVIRSWEVVKDPIPDLQPYQFFAMLELSGNKEKLYQFINDLPSPNNIVAKAKLEHTLTFNRNDSLVKLAQANLGLSDDVLDGLWKQALTL